MYSSYTAGRQRAATCDPANVIKAPALDQPSADGNINHQFTVPTGTAAGTIKYTIKASDKDNKKQGTNDKGQFTIGGP